MQKIHILVLLVAQLVFSEVAYADEASAPDHGEETGSDEKDKGWTIEEVRARSDFIYQNGNGFQSQDGPIEGPGSEELFVFQPMAAIRVRQNDQVTHTATLPVDIVVAASVDAIDEMSSASRVNEALDFTMTTEIEDRKTDSDWALTWGAHAEEFMGSAYGGVGWSKGFFNDNFTLSINGNGIWDRFKAYGPVRQTSFGIVNRYAANGNVSLAQVLSPTTLGTISYGITYQTGTLETPWNSVPTQQGFRTREILPGTRLRHALAFRVSQYIVPSDSILKASYRFYADDFDIRANTVEGRFLQYLPFNLFARLRYRIHQQTSVAFFHNGSDTTPIDEETPRTADSDLDDFVAHEFGFKLGYFIRRFNSALGGLTSVDMRYVYYTRSNDLRAHTFSMGYGQAF